MTYVAYITKIKNIKKHPNADRLMIGECFGNQVVVGLDTKEGDLGIYFQTDGKLSMEFLTANNLIGSIDPNTGERSGGFFDERGKVRTQKFRGEKSDGYFCGLSSLSFTGIDISTLTEGTPFVEINGIKICEKYITEKTKSARSQKKKIAEKVKFPIFHEHIDTEQLAYNIDSIKPESTLVITEKLHGTSQRSSYSLAVSYSKFALFVNGLFKREIIKPTKEWKYVCGTRRVVIKDFDRVSGFFKDDEIFRKNAHNIFVGKLRKGETVYYEIVGYLPSGKTIMPTVSNEKLGKEFRKKYGKETTFHYGCPVGTFEVYVYRMTISNEDGDEIDYTHDMMVKRCDEMAVDTVPFIFKFVYKGDKEILLESLTILIDGTPSFLAPHIMEGVVVRVDSSEWKAWKHKSFEFMVIEGIIKDVGELDAEEVEDLVCTEAV